MINLNEKLHIRYIIISLLGDEPFSNLQVGDLGDVPITIYNIFEAIKDIRKFISEVLKEECTPLTMGGDHTITYPILQAMKVMIIFYTLFRQSS